MKRLYTIFLILFFFAANAQVKEIHILSVNDIHAAINQFPQFSIIVDSLRNIHPNLLLLSAGDNRTGNPINDTHPIASKPMVDLMNYVGFKFSALGNHEFDGGISGLRTVINNSNFRHLCANINVPDSCRLHIEPFKFINIDGVKLGILGLVQTNPVTGYPDAHIKLFGPIKFRPVKEVAREYAWLRQQCDVFILLSHIGYKEDLELAHIMPEADLIIGGHSHTKVDPYKIENNIMITQSGSNLKYATHITVKIENGKIINRDAQLITINNCEHKDSKVETMIEEFNDNKVLKRVLTTSTTDFNRKEELGCMMADAYRFEHNADIGIQNRGGVRYESKEKGDFSVYDVYRLEPFQNETMEYILSGKELEEALVNICKTDNHGPAFVSGIKYFIHFGKTRQKIKKIKITMADGSNFDKKKKYHVVMSSYSALIGNVENETRKGKKLPITTTQTIINYLEKQPSINYQGVHCLNIKFDKRPKE